MSISNSLPPAEQARQLANPEGALGLEIAEWLNERANLFRQAGFCEVVAE